MIDHIRLTPQTHPITPPWRWAGETVRERHSLIVTVWDKDGHFGLGEAAPWPELGTESLDQAQAALAAIDPMGDPPQDLPPASAMAYESALLDLGARRAGCPLYRMLGGGCSSVRVNAILGPLDDMVVPRARQMRAKGFSVAKVKLGCLPWQEEVQRLIRLGDQVPDLSIRADANAAWDMDTALRVVDGLTGHPLESLEEPLKDPSWEGLARLQERTDTPLAVDENAPRLGTSLFERRPVQRLILKPTLVGGPVRALVLARLWGIEHCVVTTCLEGPVGQTLCLHTALALGNDLAHGLDTGVISIRQGRAQAPSSPGLGLQAP